MNILHVCKKYPPMLGGDAVVVGHLVRQQRHARHRVAVVTSRCADIPESASIYKVGLADTAAGLDTITLRRVVSLVLLGAAMFGIIRRERPHVIHTHSVDMAFFVSFAARWYKVPVVNTFHIVTFYDDNQSLLRRKTELWFAKHARLHAATAPNNYDVSQLQSGGLPHATLLPNGVDVHFWQTRSNSQPTAPFTFVAVGRLETQKGYEYLIAAAAILKKNNPDFAVRIVGDGSLKTDLQSRIDHTQLGDTVQLVGQKTADQTRELLHAATAAVFPSLYETTPLTLLEAWATGVPVIATPVGILRDTTTGQPAYIVPQKDASALAAAMQHCMNDTTARAMLAAEGQTAAKRYAWPNIAQIAESIYRGAL